MKRSMATPNFVVFAISLIVLTGSIIAAFNGKYYSTIAVGALFLTVYSCANLIACLE